MKIRSLLLYCTLFLVTSFCIFVFIFQNSVRTKAVSRIKNHANVIASSVWTLEKSSPTAYLNLAVEANGYDEIVVIDDQGGLFLKITGDKPKGIERLLRSLGLIHTYRLESPVVYDGMTIGKIAADWPCRTIYTYLYVFFCMVLMLTGIGLYLKLLDVNRFLEDRVQQRTAELKKEVNERRRAEEELKSYAQRLSMHVLNTPLGVIEWDQDFRVVEWNKAAEKIFEYTREEALGKRADDLILPADERENVENIWRQLILQTGGTRSVNTNCTKSGHIRICEWHNTSLTGPNGAVIGVGSLLEDITERKQAEQEKQRLEAKLLQAQKMEAVGELAGGIAHDFNNLLQSISGYTQLLLIDCVRKQEECNRLRGIEQASAKAADLIRRLLTFSRKIESHLLPLNLNDIIMQMRDMLERTIPKMIAFEYHLDPELKQIDGDATQIEQVIMNLSINAMHAMPDGGRIIIETENVHLDQDYCLTHLGSQEGPHVILSVSDNGIGMDQETVTRIYEPFFTTKGIGRGTGLGLSTVYGIVKSHRAQIQCYSEPAKGTRFQILFPARVDRVTCEEDQPAEEHIPGGTETILLIDDDDDIRDIGIQMLERNGYNVMDAENGEEGLRLFEEQQKKIDLVILDLNMPGMGGYKCMQALKTIDPETRILIASGYAPRGDIQKALEEGACGYIVKPFQLIDFLKKVRFALDADAQ